MLHNFIKHATGFKALFFNLCLQIFSCTITQNEYISRYTTVNLAWNWNNSYCDQYIVPSNNFFRCKCKISQIDLVQFLAISPDWLRKTYKIAFLLLFPHRVPSGFLFSILKATIFCDLYVFVLFLLLIATISNYLVIFLSYLTTLKRWQRTCILPRRQDAQRDWYFVSFHSCYFVYHIVGYLFVLWLVSLVAG